MKRAGKLLYVPGLISLIGILIALPSFYKQNIPTKEYCLPLFVLADTNKKDWFIMPLKQDMEKYIAKKKKIKFEFDENKIENYKKLEIIRYEALKLKYTLDTSTVILLSLSDSISYGEFVSIVDMCETNEQKRYASWDNKFVIFGEPPKEQKQTTDTLKLLRCGYMSFKKPMRKPGFFEFLSKKINKYYTSQGLYLVLGWVVLLISFFSFRKRNARLQTCNQ